MRTAALPLPGLILFAASGLTLLTAPAAGQGPGSLPATPTAEERLELALKCYARFDLDCALRRLGEAQTAAEQRGEAAARLRGKIHLHQGVCHGVLNHPALAERAFELALTHDPEIDLDPEHFKPALVARFRDVRSRLLGTLTVVSDSEGAAVEVDGVRVGATPYSAKFPVGPHRVRVSQPGARRPYVQRVVVRVGGTFSVHAALGPARASGSTTRSRMPHREQGVSRSDRSSRRRFWTWAAAGAAVVTLAVAVGLGSSAAADYRAWEDELGKSRQRWDELRDSAETKAAGANVLFVTSGVLAITAVVLFFLEGRTVERTTSLGPSPGGSLGLSLTRLF